MNRLDLQTPDFVAANAARLAEIFPNCVSETRNPQTGEIKRAIDFDLLRQELAYDIVEGPQERYRLDWPGKREALALANEPIRKTLRPCKDESVDFDTTQNLYIEGDNLDALKLLQETYLGKVKMIYIDPPYNTGNDFIYDDNFSISREEYQASSGALDEEGNAMFQEEKWRQNSSASGRFHSEWLSMMYPRLKLARNLLREDGLIYMSCDDIEVANLTRLSEEIFGSANRMTTFIWKSRVSEDIRARTGVSDDCEYIICFSKTDQIRLKGVPKDLTKFSNPDDDARGPWRSADMTGLATKDRRPNLHYDLTNPATGITYPCSEKGWRFDKKGMEKRIIEKRILWPDSPTGRPRQKLFLADMKDENKSISSFIDSAYTSTSHGTREANALFGGPVFDFPKPSSLVHLLCDQTTGEDDIILDFFSGSATTAHAVMQLNAEDGGKRRHIMVQLPEPCDEKSEAFKSGYKNIAEIGKERIRRAGKKILEEWQAKQASSTELLKLETENSGATAPDVGFRVLKIDSSNMAEVFYQPDELTQDGLMLQVDNLKPGRNPEDLLFQVLLDWGVDLTLPISKEIFKVRKDEGRSMNYEVFFVAENALAACFDTGLDEDFVKELAKRQPLRAVFRDSSYASDAVKINFEQIFKALSPHTELKTL